VIEIARKITMVDSGKTKVTVELNATSPNELVKGHVVYTSYGTFMFRDGKAEVATEHAEKLKAAGIAK
jgi:hypothetical protein